MKSIWENDEKHASFDTMIQDQNTEVLIIGGGMVGVLCGHFLGQQGVDYHLIDKAEVASGVTKNTTAKVTSQHGLIYGKLAKKLGLEVAKTYFDINQEAIRQYRDFAREIDCDFEEKNNFVYSSDNKVKILEEAETLVKIGGEAEFMEIGNLPVPIEAAVRLGRQGQFNPLKFIGGIAKGMQIHEYSFARTIERERSGYTVIVENQNGEAYRVKAKKIIVASHFPFMDKHGLYFLKMYQHRSYVIALDSKKDIGGMYIGDKTDSLSFRNYKNHLLIGGGGGRTGTTCGGYEELKRFANQYYPEHTITNQWATQDCITLDGIPYIGAYAKGLENVAVATGFNKWGMTSSMVAALILTKQTDPKTAEVFNPSRSMLKPQLLINGFESTKNMLTPTKPRCAHLKCALNWNNREKTWDCPCHGSRFDEGGSILDNPTQKEIEIK